MVAPRSKRIAFIALSSALVFIATTIFTVYIPATRGYFNLGETMIYLTALTLGPTIASIAGGLGSALADIVLGYHIYAPATFIIKSIEGFIVGTLAVRLSKISKESWRRYSVISGIIGGVAIGGLGITFYTGEMSVGPGVYIPSFTVNVTPSFWIIIGVLFAISLSYLGVKVDPKHFGYVLATLLGGLEMVCGYYIYETTIISLGLLQPEIEGLMPAFIVAFYEVPFNIMQMLVGMLIGIPLAKKVAKMLYGRPS